MKKQNTTTIRPSLGATREPLRDTGKTLKVKTGLKAGRKAGKDQQD
jgi:hypothetical protein